MDASRDPHPDPSDRRLSSFIRARQGEILERWERVVRQLPVARDLDRPALLDHLPELLDRIARMADELAAGGKPRLPPALAEIHAIERLDEGFDLAQVVTEYAVLRDCIVELWSEHAEASKSDTLGMRALNQAIDKAVGASVQRYTLARDRTLQSLDRISAAALETRSMDDLLDRLLQVLIETTEAVDTATVLLRDGNLLRVRASVGLGADRGTFAVEIGEGYAGTIAATRRPLALRSAATDPLVRNPALRAKGVKALFGVPLIDGTNVIGVAHMGSISAAEFSRQDRLLFTAMVHRASAAISQHMLREAAEAKARELEAVIESIPDAVFIGGHHGITHCNRAALELLGIDACGDVRDVPIASLLGEIESRDLDTGEPISSRESPFTRALAGIRSTKDVTIKNLKTGDEIVLRSSAAPIQRGDEVVGAVSVSANVTDQRRAAEALRVSEARLKLSEARLNSILDHAPSAIFVKDETGRFVLANRRMAKILDRPIEDILGHAEAQLLPPDVARQLHEHDRRALRDGVIEVEETIGDHTYLSTKFPIPGPGGTTLVGGIKTDITERKLMETSLREREEQFRTLADNIPQLAWMADETGSIFWYNRRWFEFTGMTLDEMRGWAWRAIHHPDHLDRTTAKFRQHIESGEAWEDTFPMRGVDGRFRWFLSRAVPVRDERGRIARWFGTNTDVTEQRLMAEATTLLSASLDYRVTLERIAALAVPALGDWCGVDLVENGVITRVAVAHADPAKVDLARELARRYPPDVNAEAGVPNVIRTGKSELVSQIPDEMLAQHARDPDHLALMRALGLASYMVVPLLARDRTLGAISLVSAESGRRYGAKDLELAEELGRRAGLAVDNASLLEEAQREARMREEILAVVSHDLKNPLGAIHLAASLLGDPQAPAARRHVETIQRAANRMDHLIGDLLDMASIQAGRLSIEKRAEDIEALLREVLELHEPLARDKGVGLASTCAADVGRLCCDRERISQVFGNLVGNAIKFCGAGDTVAVRCERDGGFARFAVSDTGPGIASEQLGHIFDRYWSAKEHAKKGTGLGLFISKGIVEAHGGRIWVDSAPGRGATFYFTVPLAEVGG